MRVEDLGGRIMCSRCFLMHGDRFSCEEILSRRFYPIVWYPWDYPPVDTVVCNRENRRKRAMVVEDREHSGQFEGWWLCRWLPYAEAYEGCWEYTSVPMDPYGDSVVSVEHPCILEPLDMSEVLASVLGGIGERRQA